jgi:phosphoenolpyruvate carboxylase
MEVYGLFLLGGWQPDAMNIDIVPLFETIDDLKNAASIMEALYQNEIYYEHLLHRRKTKPSWSAFPMAQKMVGT